MSVSQDESAEYNKSKFVIFPIWGPSAASLQVWNSKNVSRIFFVFVFFQLLQHRNLKILIPAPYNTLVIMWVRDKNFQVSLPYELRNCDNKNMRETF